ncbi:MAG: hypothetical protein G01um101470_214 [Parcubacteria group bacterium Gr01-1014_70]|nr:MAG: hypothetical protein G01um101470_214 [Parcubacteria group bacterium Gr01-1014_70]
MEYLRYSVLEFSINFYRCPIYKELNGFYFIKKYYPVADLIFTKRLLNKFGLLVFRYEKSVGDNTGLLIDLLANNEVVYDAELRKILLMFKNVFVRTLCKDFYTASDIFFRDRVATRVEKFYSRGFKEKYFNSLFCINGYKTRLDSGQITDGIVGFFKNKTKKWCIASQCDPTDLNIGIKPIVFDYLVGGLNPLMAEFATFFWQNLLQGNYLSPIYYPRVFREHDKVFKQIDKISYENGDITHELSTKRVNFICDYIDLVLKPVLIGVHYPDWYNDFKNFLAVRILGVTDLNIMTEKDRNISLAYLSLFYNLNIKDIDALRTFVKNLCQWEKR